ncbi:hypothetical protein VTN77DRAFT_9381 [Rasamsonia byssochlamydoides]|uniref:uncharacterized protein n=1 Tax=Rasamsonia byssochlamydoides TaxID=89139 RepID=UPI003742A6B2
MDRIEQVEDPNGNAAGTDLEVPRENSGPPGEPPSSPGRSSHRSRYPSRQPSIRIRRLSSVSSIDRQDAIEPQKPSVEPSSPVKDDLFVPPDGEEAWQARRRRSSSEPRPGRWSAPPAIVLSRLETSNSQYPMSPVKEETSSQFRPSMDLNAVDRLIPPAPAAGTEMPSDPRHNRSLFRRASGVALSALGRHRASTLHANPVRRPAPDEYDWRIVDLLDVVDPEVSTLSTLTNVQNSLFVPDLGNLLNRTPTYTLSRPTAEISESETNEERVEAPKVGEPLDRQQSTGNRLGPTDSISSVLGENHFAELPEGSTLEGWTTRDIMELNDHVRHMLHSRRSKFKRAMKGFAQYVSKPLGFFVTLYATLITLFGLAWVLFLIGWINVGGRQLYIINVIDNVLVALFAIMGDGLAPFRARDTYHMIYIAHYHHLTWKLRKKRTLPKLHNKNDLPTRLESEVDLERNGDEKDTEFSVLTPAQQRKLEYHSQKFAKSHTFYKPHETETHYAFPLRLLVAIVVLLDFHSIFQITLGACTWGINYHHRPFALTTVILCCSLTCNITGGVLIMIGDRMTRKKDVVKRMFRQRLTREAMKKMEKRRRKEERRNEELEQLSRPEPYAGT